MTNINIRKLIYHIRWRYLTLNNVVLTVALIIGASWTWGSIGMMQRNYSLQKTLDLKQRQQKLAELENDSLAFEQQYYQSDEYKELAARQYLGVATPGEKLLILPPNSPSSETATKEPAKTGSVATQPSNFTQWLNFLFGKNRRDLQK